MKPVIYKTFQYSNGEIEEYHYHSELNFISVSLCCSLQSVHGQQQNEIYHQCKPDQYGNVHISESVFLD